LIGVLPHNDHEEPLTEQSEKLKRVRAEALDEMLGDAIRVLDDGFVRVVDYMGSDASVVQAARVSYGAGTKQVHEDRGLIRYLMRHSHTTPFEMCEIKLHVRVPMDTWRQWIRHRTANVNEYSTRYSIAIDAAHRTKHTEWRLQGVGNRQGSAGQLPGDDGLRISQRERELQEFSRVVYEERIAAGVAREQARKDLPLSTYTEAYWKVDLHNLLHFLRLRMDAHAQWEIRQYAEVIGRQIVALWCPLVWEAFTDYKLNALEFSDLERRVLFAILQGDVSGAHDAAKQAGWISSDGTIPSSRERREFEAKLSTLGMGAPWTSSTT
jgi:thymidylate synthase (FAD)